MSTSWRIILFGSLTAQCGGRLVSRFRTEKTASLFAFLAYFADRSHSREFLAELFWPDSEPEASAHSLRVALSSLRNQFAIPQRSESLIQSTRREVRLDPQLFATDVQEFNAAIQMAGAGDPTSQMAALRSAVDVYKGRLLDGLYDSWIAPEQFRLQEHYIRACVDLAGRKEQSGDIASAAEYAARAAREDPLSESAQAIRLRLAMAGPSAANAAAVYDEILTVWRDELGEQPPIAIRKLGESLPKPALPRRLKPEEPRAQLPDRRSQAPTRQTSAPFFGRNDELAYLCRLLQPLPSGDTRKQGCLVTLTGPGGSGKTRIADELSYALEEGYGTSRWIVRLADLREPAGLAPAVMRGMGLRLVKDTPPMDAITSALSSHPSLLVLDNYEQLLPDGSAFVQELLECSPSLSIVVTSRILLGLENELEFPVAPLPIPRGTEPHEALSAISSVQLFIHRAQHAMPDFQITAANAPAVSAICARLEGMPLAIELAAARSHSLTPPQILERLSDRYELLTGRDISLDRRHRTMRGTVAWSCDLLDSEALTGFRRLSTFHGGFTLDAAAFVTGSSGAESLLNSLCAASLLNATGAADQRRWLMLETIREFGAQLMTSGERAEVERLHCEFFVRLCEAAGPEMAGPTQAQAVSRLAADHENLRAALDTAQALDPAAGLRIAKSIWRYWLAQGHHAEGRTRVKSLLRAAQDPPPDLAAEALYGAGALAAEQSDYEDALICFQHCLAGAREAEDHLREAAALNALGNVLREQGQFVAAQARYEEVLQVYTALGDRNGIANSLSGICNSQLGLGNFIEAMRLAEESLAIKRELGNQLGEAVSMELAGICARALGAYERARELHQGTALIHTRSGNRHLLAGSLHNLAAAELRLGMTGQADERLLEALSINKELGHRSWEAYNLNLLASAALRRGEIDRATGYAKESLEIRLDIKEGRNLAASLGRLAEIGVAKGRYRAAGRLLGAANEVRTKAHAAAMGDEDRDAQVLRTAIVTKLGAEETEREEARGRTAVIEEVANAVIE